MTNSRSGVVDTLRRWGAGLALGLLATFAPAQAQLMPDTQYDPAIPTVDETLGYAPGDMITSSEGLVDYLEALQAAAPDRMQITQYATSWEGRPLVYAVIASPETMARLDAVKANIAQLASGAPMSKADRDALIADTPAVLWMSFNVHGDEIAPGDAALQVAYHLLAAEDDPLVQSILANTIVIIDPSQNPDGRARFVASFRAALGMQPSDDRYAAEHVQPWPGGRFNHYLFDLNRDWFARTQPETRGKIAAVMEWYPLVLVDSHEMGGDESFFFPPAAVPFNPYLTDAQAVSQVEFGRNRGAWFDRFGIAYFTREVFDAFYPGYGDMWPALNGIISKTFEQGSTRGLRFLRTSGEELTYHETVFNIFVAVMATLETGAQEREQLLRQFADYRASAIEEGRKSDTRFYVIDLAERRYQAEAMARNLVAQGIAVSRLPAGVAACGKTYSKGALVVDRAQPTGRLIGTLLDPNTPLPADFIADQESRRERGIGHQMYDVSAWSVPLMDGVSVAQCKRVDLGGAVTVAADEPIASIGSPTGRFGYAVPWTDSGQAKLVIAALSSGLKGSTTSLPFTMGARSYPSGTVIFPVAGNPADLGAQLDALADGIGAEYVPLASSWVEDGPNFGSDAFAALKAPRVALAWGDGTSPTDVGAAWFTIERKFGIAATPIRVSTLGRADLSRYDVVVLPEAWGMSGELGGGGAAALKAFVEKGGVVVGFGTAVDVLASEDVGLLSTKREAAYSEDGPSGEDEGPAPGTRIADEDAYREMIADPHSSPDDVPGVLVNLVADPDHWLSAGYDTAVALLSGSAIYRPLNAGDGTNVFRMAGPDDVLASGYLWEENRLQLAYKPFVMAEPYGRGVVIGFAQSPVTRGYLGGLDLLFANTLVLGPAHAQAGSAR